MTRKRFISLCLIFGLVTSILAAPLLQPSVALAGLPDKPINVSPADATAGVSVKPTLVSSPFYDSDGDLHWASKWQVDNAQGDFTGPNDWEGFAQSTANLETITVDEALSYSTTYWWRVCYCDSVEEWSEWSEETSFTTVDAPQADFTADRVAVTAGQEIHFTDGSTGGVTPLTYSWDFGDGSTSTEQNPEHEYSSAGTYTVSLTVTDAVGTPDTEEKQDYITVAAGLVADFRADRTAVVEGQTIAFTNLTSGGSQWFNSYEWDFNNDGTVDSSAQNPTYAYTSPGVYTVVLTVTSPWDSDDETKEDYITVSPRLQADFSADRVVAVAGQTIQFTDRSTGGVTPLTYQWDFGDSLGSTMQNPTHTYSSPGKYTVTLTVTDSATNTASVTKADYVTILAVAPPQISGVGATNITPTSATIVWTTNEGATSQVEYGLTASYGSVTRVDTTLVTSHSVTISSLTPYRTYHYRVISSNAAGSPSYSADFTFTTPDDTPPSKPAVTDDGASTTSFTELHAAWTCSDPESGIVEYQYAIGTTAGGTDVVNWTTVGTQTEVTRGGLTLTWGATYYFSVKARNGQGLWSTTGSSNGIQVADPTPPSTPVVTDDGDATTSTSQLHATWSCDDPESGIEKYQYAIGTTRGGTDVVGWTSVGVSEGVTRTGLKLTVGVSYYFSVRARNADGLWSSVGVSDGILVAPQGTGQGDISEAGGTVQTGDGKVTAVFPAGAVSGTVTVSIRQIAPPSYASPEGFRVANTCFTIEVTDGTGKAVVAFSQPIALWVEYSESDAADAGGDPDNLALAYWDEATAQWKIVDTEANTSKMALVAYTAHLSTWAVLAEVTPADSGGIPPLVWLLCLIGVAAVAVPVVLTVARKRFYLEE
ncbi:MAG: PKD domain-containing protein [Dehalococcoidia bacterium]|nr:PKD domain-containing protein [Dehalococcoidia bacterium]